MARTLLALIVLLSSCDEPPEVGPAPEAKEARPEGEAPAPETAERAVEAPRPSVPPAAPLDVPDPPATGCAFGTPTLVQAGEGWADVVALGGGFVVAGVALAGEREEAFVARIDGHGARTLARGPLEQPVPRGHRRAGVALAANDGRLALAAVDGRRRLLLAEVQGDALAWRVIAEGASLRFAPALTAFEEGWAIGWTREQPALRVEAALVGDALRHRRELYPAGGGSAAPAFLASEPSLLFLDPRAGVSVVLRSRLGADGFGEPTVARPLNLVTDPPAVAVVRAAGTDWIAYTAIGNAATTAVGLARLDGSAPPVALVPGTGYGVLHVDAAPLGEAGAIFVADAPRASEPEAPRELHVRTLSTEGTLGAPTAVRGSADRASRGRIAQADGVVAVTFQDPAGLHVVTGRCALHGGR